MDTRKHLHISSWYLRVLWNKLWLLKPTMLLGSFGFLKLDGVGPLITDPWPTSSTNLSKIYIYNFFWHVTCETWHMTRDMANIVSKFQVRGSNPLVGVMFWRLGEKESLNELIDYNGVSRTPGLLNMSEILISSTGNQR